MSAQAGVAKATTRMSGIALNTTRGDDGDGGDKEKGEHETIGLRQTQDFRAACDRRERWTRAMDAQSGQSRYLLLSRLSEGRPAEKPHHLRGSGLR